MTLKEDVCTAIGMAYILKADINAMSNDEIEQMFDEFENLRDMVIKMSVIIASIVPKKDFQDFSVDWLSNEDEP